MTGIRFKLSRLATEVKYSLVQFSRNRRSIFFTFILPILFLVLGWYLFGVPSGPSYIRFLVPGILGIAIMGSAIDVTVGVISGYRAAGMLKKIGTTPMSVLEWNLSRVITGMFIVAFSSAACLLAAWLMFGYVPEFSFMSVLFVVSGAAMSVGIGMIIAYVVKDKGAANMAAFTVTFPLILVSGSIFPVEPLPGILRGIVAISPLTYLNDGLRSPMTMGDPGKALPDLAIVCGIGAVLFCIGYAAMGGARGRN